MALEERAVILRFNADLDTALRLSREDFGRQAGASLEQSLPPAAEAAFGARTIAIPRRHRSSVAATQHRRRSRSPSCITRPAAPKLHHNSSDEEDEDMRAIMHASNSGQQIQIEERCESCGFIGLHRLAQVCSSCGTQGSLTAVSRAARVLAAANRTGSSDA